MIFTDEYDSGVAENMDAGDSPVRNCIREMVHPRSGKNWPPLFLHFTDGGKPCRYKHQTPWNNPKNLTPDNMIAIFCGLVLRSRYLRSINSMPEMRIAVDDALKRIFWYYVKNFFLVDRERDFAGTTKYPWPHMVKDVVKPDPRKEEIEVVKIYTRNFDFATPVLPDRIWAMIYGARIYWLYWFALIGIPCHLVALFIHRRNIEKALRSSEDIEVEQNQMIFQSIILGDFAEVLFNYFILWEYFQYRYWVKRGEREYYKMTQEYFTSRGHKIKYGQVIH